MTSTRRKFTAYLLAGAVLAVGIVAAQNAGAAHVRAKSATPFSAPLVIAYNECVGGTGSHNPLFLAGASCPSGGPGPAMTKTSGFITSGDPVANGAPAQFQGRLVQVFSAAAPAPNCGGGGGCKTIMFNPGVANATSTNTVGGNQSYAADVRCGPLYPAVHPACASVNPSGPPDYAGFLSANSSLRITDHNNDPAGGTGAYATAGTVAQLLFTVPVSCATTAAGVSPAAGIGSFCVPAATDAHALCGCIRQTAGGLANIEEGQIEVVDGNINANPFDTTDGPNSAASRQGVFIP